jgi:hypothetical protein
MQYIVVVDFLEQFRDRMGGVNQEGIYTIIPCIITCNNSSYPVISRQMDDCNS